MQDLMLSLASVLLLSAGFLSPFIMTLAYVWVDTFLPQMISNGTLSAIPVALIFGAFAVFMYIVKDRRDPPKFDAILGMQIALAIWMTVTLLWARNPDPAFHRWDNSVKVVVFAAFIPFAIRTRVQIEAFVLVYLFSIAGHLMPWGIKTFLTGGGYGLSLGLLRSNSSMLAESSAMSGVGVMIAPLVLVMTKNSILLPRTRIRTLGAAAMIVLGLVASIGTFARTALIAISIAGGSMWLRSKRKFVFTLAIIVLGGIMFSVTSDKWTSRISTVADYKDDSSAMGRILVWRWAWEYATTHPFGGGFEAYMGNAINVPAENGQAPWVMIGRAYHNIYFSALGDLGYPGLFLFSGILGLSLLAGRKARLLTRDSEEHAWCADLAQATQVALVTLMATGFFVDISYFPVLWYLVSLSACLRQYAIRVATPKRLLSDGPAGAPARSALPPPALASGGVASRRSIR